MVAADLALKKCRLNWKVVCRSGPTQVNPVHMESSSRAQFVGVVYNTKPIVPESSPVDLAIGRELCPGKSRFPTQLSYPVGIKVQLLRTAGPTFRSAYKVEFASVR